MKYLHRIAELSSRMFAVFLSLLLIVGYAPSQAAETGPSSGFTELATGIYVRYGKQQLMSESNNGDIANTGFIVGEKSVAVIDPGGSPELGHLLRKAIETTSNLPVSHVILTHMHPDHVFGSAAFTDIPVVVAHKNYARAATQRADFYKDAFSYLLPGTAPATLVPTMVDFAKLDIDLGGRIITVVQHATAHTDNDVSVWDANTRTLWASDLLFVDRIPSLDGSLPGWIAVMDKLGEYPIDLVIPGHGTAGQWDQLSRPQYRYLNKVLAQVRAILASNGRLLDAVHSVASDEAGQWLLFESRHAGNITKAFTELEWE